MTIAPLAGHACHSVEQRYMIGIMSPPLIALLDRLEGREIEFAAGAPVFHLGDPVRCVHVVRSGVVHLVRHQDNGSALILQRAGPNSILAEASLYSASYHCAAQAEIAAVTWAIPRTGLLARIENDTELAIAWARHLAHEVQQARLQSEILSLKTVAARLDAWVSWHGSLPARGHWSTLAHEIGVSPEALYREIALRRRQHVVTNI
ncbi:Crp/Fnr family transcriptional regulator [Mesorhizobium erdmanii]|nr:MULTISPECIES: Crp/Fnr family transcriptional regulator [Mesorhizobium]